MAFFIGFSEPKFKAQLKMCIQRVKLLNNKIENEVKRLKREIAGLLNKPQKEEEKAKIKCEHLIRGDHTVAAHCIIELLCEALIARVKLLAQTKHCPEDLLQAVSTLIYCSTRVDIPELKKIRQMLGVKYKKSFVERALVNADYNVNTTVIQKLNIANPKEGMVRNYLKSIADEFGFVWEPQEEKDAMSMSEAPVGRDVNPAAATGFTSQYGADGTPILYGYTENAAEGGPGAMTALEGPGMLPGPPQYAQPTMPMQQPQQPQQPQFGASHANAQHDNPNINMIGTFGANPNTSTSAAAMVPHFAQPQQQWSAEGEVACPTCGSMVHGSKLRAAVIESTTGMDFPPPCRGTRGSDAQPSNDVGAIPGPPPTPGTEASPNNGFTFSSESTSTLLPPPAAPGPSVPGIDTSPGIPAGMDDFGIPMAPTGAPGANANNHSSNEMSPPPPPPQNLTDTALPGPPPAGTSGTSSGAGEAPDMDELMARFNNLME